MKYLDLLVCICYISLIGGQIKMCAKEKLEGICSWIKIVLYLIGFVASAIICISSIITIPEKINNHETRIATVEKDVNDIKINTNAKLSSLQEDVRLIKEVLLKQGRR